MVFFNLKLLQCMNQKEMFYIANKLSYIIRVFVGSGFIFLIS